MFVPFGFFASRYTKTKKMWPIFVLSLITSLTIELVQLQIGRSFDIDDIILNVVGGMSGYLLFVGLKAIKNHLPSFLQKDFIYNLICIIIIAALVIYYLKFKGMWWF
jgi:glycopeptide antibiotics resistance protein